MNNVFITEAMSGLSSPFLLNLQVWMKYIFLDNYTFLEGDNRYCFIPVKLLCRICNLVRHAPGKYVILRGRLFCFIIVSRAGLFPLKRSSNVQFGIRIPEFIAGMARGG